MRRTKQMLGTVSVLALIAMTSQPAMAQGTSAGTDIINEVSVTYDVGGVTQTPIEASDTLTVDRRIDVVVNYVQTSPTTVNPGENNVAIAFDVTNSSNATIDLALSAALLAGTDANIDDENFQFFLDVNGDRVLDGGDTAITSATLAAMGEDETRAVLVVTNIELTAANGDTFDVALTANAVDGSGNDIADTSGANTVGVDTVLADGAGTNDVANQGDFSDTGEFVVSGANVTVVKTSEIISDPVNGTTNPKAIPGATIKYCIRVSNASGAATATNISVVDDLPADVTFQAGSANINGDASCLNGSTGGTYDVSGGTNGGGTVTGTLSDIAADETLSLYFNVTVD